MHKPQRESSYSAPDEGAGGCTSRSNLQSPGWHVVRFRIGDDARIAP